jgi:glutamate-1-semialdehyde aminotransferase
MSQLAVQDPVFVSSTLFGNVLSLAAAKTTMEIISGWVMQRIRSTGKRLIRLETELAAEFPFYSIMGDPERSVSYAGKFNGALVRKLLESGVIKNRPNFPTVQHTDHEINKTIEMIRRALVWIDHHQDEAAQIEAFQLFRNR